jgi:hypothetical protein
MSDSEKLWERRHVAEVGLSLEFYRPWPLESQVEAGRGNIYQRIADTGGLVFLRYGADETVDASSPGSRLHHRRRAGHEEIRMAAKARRVTVHAPAEDRVYRHRVREELVHEAAQGFHLGVVIGFTTGVFRSWSATAARGAGTYRPVLTDRE